MEMAGFDPAAFRMQSGRSTNWSTSPKKTTPTRFELAIPEGNGLAVHRLNHSATVSKKNDIDEIRTREGYAQQISSLSP